jgi:hypothetical protein
MQTVRPSCYLRKTVDATSGGAISQVSNGDNPIGTVADRAHNHGMQVHFHRTDGHGGYVVLMRRDDGLTVRLPGYDRKWRIPHHMAHFAAEREFHFGQGVFGSIAAGALFSNMSVVAGRPRSDLTARSRSVIKAHTAELGLAEAVSGVVHDGVEHGAAPHLMYARLVETWSSMRPGPCPYPPTTLRRCLAVLALLESRWREIGVGQRLALRWESPTPTGRSNAA